MNRKTSAPQTKIGTCFNFTFKMQKQSLTLRKIQDKKWGISQANLALEEDNCITSNAVCFSKMDTYLDDLAAPATQEKDALDQLVNNNVNLIT